MKKIIAFVLALLMVMSLGVTAFAEGPWTVSIKERNDQIINEIRVNDGGKVTKPSDPQWEGYKFVAWCLDSENGTPWDFNNQVHGNITLVAKWEKCYYTVTFYNQGHGTAPGKEENVEYNSKIKSPGGLAETGYTFEGWYKEPECINLWNFETDTVKSNIALYAKWTINVTFNLQEHGIGTVETQHIKYGETATEPNPAPTDANWVFKGWYTESVCTNQFEFSTPITEPTDLFAKWLELHKVTFQVDKSNVEGIENAPAEQKIVNGGYVKKPEIDPTSTSHDFKGWYKEDACTNEWKFDSDTVTEDTKIYAKWEIKKFDVTFDMGGVEDAENVPEAQKVEYKNKAQEPTPAPSKDKYVFRDWVNAEGTPFNFDTEITADTTIYAKWLKLIDKPTASKTTFTYTGEEQTIVLDNPNVSGDYTVTGNTGTVVDDYTATYALVDTDNTAWNEAEHPTANVTIDWSIEKATISPKFTENVTCTYGDDILAAAKAKVADENSVVIASNDIVIKYKAEGDENFTDVVPTDVGTYTLAVNVDGSDNYNGYFEDDVTSTLTINPKEIDIIWANTAFVYNGKDQTSAIEATFENINGEDIFLDVDVTGGKFKNAGTYTVTAKLRNGYENYKLPSSAATSYTIAPKDISGAEIELGDALVYSGKNQTQTVKKVKIGDLELTYADYDISGNIKKNVGTYTLTVTGKGNFTGTATKQFVVIPGKNYDFKEDKHGNIKIGDGKIGFKDNNEKHTPEISFAGDKGDLVEMLVKMGKITPADLVRIANGETLNVMLETQKAYVSDRVWDKIEKRAGSKEIDSYFDISFYLYWNNDTENRTDITDTSGYGYITIEVEAPDVKNAKSRSYSVIRYHNDGYRGHAVELSAKYSSKYDTLTFRTNQFSVYAIAYSKVNDKDDEEGKIVINGKGDKKKEDKKDINPNTGALVF